MTFLSLSNLTEKAIFVFVILFACQWQFEPTFLNFWTFGKILSHLRKDLARLWDHMHSPWRSECSWRLIFEPPKIVKIELSFERELNLGNIRWHIFFTFLLARTIKKHENWALACTRAQFWLFSKLLWLHFSDTKNHEICCFTSMGA